ncbi:MAG: response regulator transcription factor [Clostridium sp.]|jgi:DNA-binding response OmpR family regulator|nr:response regulator transcription factor [Clostridium sp.]
MRILVAEDERDMNSLLCKRLRAEGYAVDGCFDGAQARDFAEAGEYDAMVLDVMMPYTDGFSLVEELRGGGDDTPVIFLSARDSVADRVRGLDLGANDYLIKPFSIEELLARLRVLLRLKSGITTNILRCADLTLDLDKVLVTRGDKRLTLSVRELELLECLMRNEGRVLSRSQIENHIYNFDFEGGTNVVDVYISYLRKKIDDPFPKKLIHTVRGRGYVLRSEEEV